MALNGAGPEAVVVVGAAVVGVVLVDVVAGRVAAVGGAPVAGARVVGALVLCVFPHALKAVIMSVAPRAAGPRRMGRLARRASWVLATGENAMAPNAKAPFRYKRTAAALVAGGTLALGAACSSPAKATSAGLGSSLEAVTPPTTIPPTTTATEPTTTTTTVPMAAVPVATAPPTTAAPTTTMPPPPTTAKKAPVEHTAPCGSNLPAKLASTGGGGQLITVESGSYLSAAVVEAWSKKRGGCWVLAGGPWDGRIGANGFSTDHKEGEATTPVGLFSIGSTMYGNAPDPGVHEQYVKLQCGDWWDENPSSADYNRFDPLSCSSRGPGGGSEALWTETDAYPSFAVIDYNTDPVIPGKGSGIFFHNDTGSATAGCVSIPRADLDWALDWIEPGESPHIVMAPTRMIEDY